MVVAGEKRRVTILHEEKTIYFLHGGDWVERESDHTAEGENHLLPQW